jgi:hypothetical protein
MPERATALHDLKKLSDEETARLREDLSMSSRDRCRMLAEVLEATRTGAEQLLGSDYYVEYVARSGGWLTNLVSLP